ncbi:hypothetical protein [Nonomuraea guangzhouensis]|uniref:Holin n=1 Tax=Nonomuraea guangzhouensis TaxID=1291555 RepID=A0ABW4GSX4_9ACTN|nr:hypothetical protein [Nonomuraea guangzhouensis]
MSDQSVRLKGDRLSRTERIIAGTAGAIVTVDNDLATFAAILAAIGAAAALIAVLGIRFNTVKAAGAELARTDTEGLAPMPRRLMRA